MKSSSGRFDPLNLERDLPTTLEDVAAQKRHKADQRPDTEDYLRFLARFDPISPDELRRKRGPRGDSPFELLPRDSRNR